MVEFGNQRDVEPTKSGLDQLKFNERFAANSWEPTIRRENLAPLDIRPQIQQHREQPVPYEQYRQPQQRVTTPGEVAPQAPATPVDRSTGREVLPVLTITSNMPEGKYNAENKAVVVVDKATHRTRVLQLNNGRVEEILNVPDATGKGPKMTPEGRFNIIAKETNPWWYPPAHRNEKPVPPGPDNPLGPAKIRTDGFGGLIMLHGTSKPHQIGQNVSRGCVRHHNEDIMKIYPMLKVGEAVYITNGLRNVKIRPEDFSRRR